MSTALQDRWLRVPDAALRRGHGAFEVHSAMWPGDEELPTLVAVHGLGGSHVNWALLAPLLVDAGVVGTIWAPDLAGFGLTTPGARSASLEDNLDLLQAFVRTVSDRPAVVIGNSMGGLLSLRLAANHPHLVAALGLIDPAAPGPLGRTDPEVFKRFAAFAVPGLGERFLRRQISETTPEEQVAATMQLVAADPGALDELVIGRHVAIAEHRRSVPTSTASFLQAARSLVAYLTLRRRSFWSDVDAVRVPTLLLHGEADRLVRDDTTARLARRRPEWTYHAYADLGHVPMLEAPQRVADDLRAFLAACDLAPRSEA